MAVDQRVMDIADGAVAHVAPTHADVEYLLGFDGYSVEAAYVAARAREIAFEASGGVGTIHAQIGVDAYPCPMNCQYCAFAEVNAEVCELGTEANSHSGARNANLPPSPIRMRALGDDAMELPIESIVDAARVFDEGGVQLISLMSTAGLPFARYLEMVAAVRQAVGDDMTVLANTRDMSLREACALKEAGANAAYHALRLGEGVITNISPDRRRKTIANIREAGLELMTGVEPVWEQADRAELADRLCELPSFDPFCIGACGLTSAAGTVLSGKGLRAPRTGFVRYVGAIARLVCGYDVPFGGVGGSVWVDAGTDPRKRHYADDPDTLRRSISRARKSLEKDGWTVPTRS